MDIGFILDVWLGSEYASETMFPWMFDSWAAIWEYTKISLQKTLFNLKLKVKVLKEGSTKKDKKYFQYARQALCNCNEMFKSQILSKTHLESTFQNHKTCTPRYSHGKYSQLQTY